MAVPRPVPGNTALTLVSILAVCDQVDALNTLLGQLATTVTSNQNALVAEQQSRINAVASEAVARGMADAGEVQARQAAIAAEAAARAQAIGDTYNVLVQAITGLRTELIGAINNEQQQRTAGDQSLQADYGAMIAALTKSLAGKVDAGDFADLTASLGALTTASKAQRTEFTALPGRPGDAPARYTFVAAASALGGPRVSLPLLPAGMMALSDAGFVARIRGAGILAGRAVCPLEPGRLYRLRSVVQRRINPVDPAGDAVVVGIAYLDQGLGLIGDVVAIRTYPALVTALGRQEWEALVSRTPGTGAVFTPPARARFAVPVVVTYGPDALTDVEVLDIEDVTGAEVRSPSLVDFEARLTALENGSYASRLEAVEQAVGTPSKLTFGAKGDAGYATIPASVQMVELFGSAFVGDGGGGLYVRTDQPLGPGDDGFTSHGAIFIRVRRAPGLVSDEMAAAWAALPDAPPQDRPAGTPFRNGNGIGFSS